MTARPEPAPFVPSNPLEFALVQARDGRLPIPEFLRLLLASKLAVPSASEVEADGRGLQPLVFDKQGTAMMAVFSSPERAAVFADVAPYLLYGSARGLLQALAPDVGIVLNPTYDLGLDIPPRGIAAVLRDVR